MTRGRIALLLFLISFTFGGSVYSFSDQQEINIGRKIAFEVEWRYGLWHDPRWEERIARIGQELVHHTKRTLPYTFKIINVRKANAFALPGGFVYITRGLLPFFQNDGEIAAVLAHEISHVELDHFAQEYGRASTFDWLAFGATLLTHGAARMPLKIAAMVDNYVLEPGYSRTEETQADLHGVDLMIEAGLNPEGMVELFQDMKNKEGERGSFIPWLRSHPYFSDRIAAIKGEIAKFSIVPAIFAQERVITGEVLP